MIRYEKDKKETSYIAIDTLLIYTLWYEFSNVFVAQSGLGKKKIHKNSTHLDHSYLNSYFRYKWTTIFGDFHGQ